jgi:hypothetical protein
VLTVEPSRVIEFAAAIRPADDLTPVCVPRRPTATASTNLKD